MPRPAIPILALFLVIAVLCPQPSHGAAPLNQPGPRDLVVFIAKEKPTLYRLVGRRAAPFGNARLEQPIALIADQRAGCFYVLDNPKYTSGEGRILRVTPDGRSSVVFHAKRQGGPFCKVSTLSLGPAGRLFLVGKSIGVYEIIRGRAEKILTGTGRQLPGITAALPVQRGQVLLATAYEDWVDPGGESSPPRHRHRPGNIFALDLNNLRAGPRVAVPNQRPGGQYFDTYWRCLRQILPDAAGRLMLVDQGSKTAASETYTGYAYGYRQQKNYLGAPKLKHAASIINGGVLVLHPNGRIEDLTYKNPTKASGPLRHPRGIAQWDQNTYIVADPEMYVKSLGQCGGLMLLGLNGSRDPRWYFGQGIRPCGVAVLRGVATGVGQAQAMAQAEPASLAMHQLATIRSGGTITHITSLKVSANSPQNARTYSGSILGWSQASPQQAAARLRQVCQGAVWQVHANGAAAWAARGQALGQASPFSLAGTSRVDNNLGLIVLKSRSKNMFDTRLGSLKARVTRGRDGGMTADVELTIMDKTERIQAVFTQTLTH